VKLNPPNPLENVEHGTPCFVGFYFDLFAKLTQLTRWKVCIIVQWSCFEGQALKINS
jgi:hypothetical protein